MALEIGVVYCVSSSAQHQRTNGRCGFPGFETIPIFRPRSHPSLLFLVGKTRTKHAPYPGRIPVGTFPPRTDPLLLLFPVRDLWPSLAVGRESGRPFVSNTCLHQKPHEHGTDSVYLFVRCVLQTVQ
ncbi:hypothetical protein ZHAS_00002986 [Anopheles sinensis]|uniref:Uncharacterized protein n=1 Tax=Anopheles sinensis TaxID=74873 RepID=A0A084VDE7_ANOSI|nr:hypothetical protein ZHAS_00002986 [Anopheles sinensis]